MLKAVVLGIGMFRDGVYERNDRTPGHKKVYFQPVSNKLFNEPVACEHFFPWASCEACTVFFVTECKWVRVSAASRVVPVLVSGVADWPCDRQARRYGLPR